MSKIYLYIATFLLSPALLFSQSVRPVQSESMYMQLRSMETGPWEFSPDKYYYSKVTRRRKVLWVEWTWREAGFGVHDRGLNGWGIGGDGYVNKYKPNAKVRAKMLALAEITRKQYESVAELHKKVGERELVDATDRKIDLAIRVYESRIKELKQCIRSLCNAHLYRESGNGTILSDRYASGQVRSYFHTLESIEESIKIIGKSYVKNAERSKAYLKEIQKLVRLKNKIYSDLRLRYLEDNLFESYNTVSAI